MTKNTFFPPDVRLEVEGEPTRQHYGIARSALFKTLQRAGINGVSHLTTRVTFEGAEISASIAGPITTVRIVSRVLPRPDTTKESVLTRDELAVDTTPPFGMLTGWVRKSSPLEWYPASYVATAYKIPSVWQALYRLTAVSSNYASTKPSMFSGAMKRWVQAIYGMGYITDDSPLWTTGTKPTPLTRSIPMPYSHGWNRTHGIVKTGAKNHWLVVVDRDVGVLAMPLPLLRSTTTQAYRDRIAKVGDVGTLRILDEFGGLPSGEDFPVGGYLTLFLAQGRGLRLLTASQLEPFYTDNTYWSSGRGWAFSETTGEAHNTCWYYMDIETGEHRTGLRASPKYTPPPGSDTFSYPTGGDWINYLDPYKPKPDTIRGEHWMLDIFLSEHDKSQLALGNPVGYGTATLAQQHAGLVQRHCAEELFVPYDLSKARRVYSLRGVSLADMGYPTPLITTPASQVPKPVSLSGWGAVVDTFFVGDYLQRVKWVPKTHLQGLSQYVKKTATCSVIWGIQTGDGSGTWIVGPYGPVDYTRSAWGGWGAGELYSPPAFVCNTVDLRAASQSTPASGSTPSAEPPPSLYIGPGPANPFGGDWYAPGSDTYVINDYFNVSLGGELGTWNVQIGAVLPPYCREGFVTWSQKRKSPPIVVRSGSRFFTLTGDINVFLPPRPTNIYGYGDFDIYARFAASFEATGTQYVMDDGVGDPTNPYRPVRRINVRTDMSEVLPEAVNWTGAHHDSEYA